MKTGKIIKKFHQFIKLEKGPVNTAIFDSLKGNIFQVENEIIEMMNRGVYAEIREFIESAEQEGLIIEVESGTWIPDTGWDIKTEDIDGEEVEIELHVAEGIDPDNVMDRLKGINPLRIVFYGRDLPKTRIRPEKIKRSERDFRLCAAQAKVDGKFQRIDKDFYLFNKKYNSCWGCTIAVTADGKIRPCVFSEIIIGDIKARSFDLDIIMEKTKEYWYITKDKIRKCKDCELRYFCFDCREIVRRESGDLFGAPPGCGYNPYKGTWK